MQRLMDDHHRLALGPTAMRAWDRKLEVLPPGDRHFVGELCRIDDLDASLAELRESLPAGARVVFVEHFGRPGVLGRLQHAWGEVAARLPWGCHVGRDVVAAFRRAGFHVIDLERFTMPTPVPVLRSWVSGVALVPAP
jgi:hypothetical protein